jgi:hypothetical protein
MNRFGILATLQSRPGKEAEVEQFLHCARPLVDAETGTRDVERSKYIAI